MKRTALALTFATVAALGVTAQPAQAAPTTQVVSVASGPRCGRTWWIVTGIFPWWC